MTFCCIRESGSLTQDADNESMNLKTHEKCSFLKLSLSITTDLLQLMFSVKIIC